MFQYLCVWVECCLIMTLIVLPTAIWRWGNILTKFRRLTFFFFFMIHILSYLNRINILTIKNIYSDMSKHMSTPFVGLLKDILYVKLKSMKNTSHVLYICRIPYGFYHKVLEDAYSFRFFFCLLFFHMLRFSICPIGCSYSRI